MAFEMIILLCIGGFILLAGLFAILTFNNLITLKNRIDNAWAQIDVQLKRRYDLIPNLIETVKGYAKHEKETLADITKYRAQLVTGTTEQKAQANNMLTGALKSLFAVAENYPDLKANENFKMLQEELTGTENKIAYVRTAYNDNVLAYNTAIQTFPSNLFVGMFNFAQKTYFEAPSAERENVKVKF